jgi:outer membrane protein assembly factor BamA
VVAAVKASVNLDFNGTGEEPVPAGRVITYNLEPVGGMLQAKYRVGSSRAWVGANYTYARTDVSFDAPEGTPGLPATPRTSKIGGLTPSLTYDSRDTLFTTSSGTYVEAGLGFFGSAFGGDDEYQKVGIIPMQFLPLHRTVTLGLRGDFGFSYGAPPFYVRPYVSLRGAPIMRYQRDNLAQGEAEVRWHSGSASASSALAVTRRSGTTKGARRGRRR